MPLQFYDQPQTWELLEAIAIHKKKRDGTAIPLFLI
jgi:hypothetical protein